jgi:hypothetical protein
MAARCIITRDEEGLAPRPKVINSNDHDTSSSIASSNAIGDTIPSMFVLSAYLTGGIPAADERRIAVLALAAIGVMERC